MASEQKGRQLVIVESPTKARTIGKYLGRGYDVAASVGHVRDLPVKELGVDVERGFEPQYVTIRGKKQVLDDLKAKAKKASNIILATDPDREGEAIAFHVAAYLGHDKTPERFSRVEFREVTKRAVEQAIAAPGRLDMQKVEAQQARRILDRIVGYQVSKDILWKSIYPGLSAGRVQTVALRLICEREAEIRAFIEEEYWSITAHLERLGQPFQAKLHKIDGKSFTLPNEASSSEVVRDLSGVPFLVTDVKRRERRKYAPPPFTTSTMQQEAAKRLRFSARRTMTTAQRLYEGVDIGGRGTVGLITYMRTDSTRVSAEAAGVARTWIQNVFGESYLPGAPQLHGDKQSKGAQEAHEAIRPADPTLHPDEARPYLEDSEARLYELIWLRFVAGQMTPAVFDTTTADFDLRGGSGRGYQFRATGSVLKFDGFTRLYREATEEGEHRRLDDLDPLPELNAGDLANLLRIEPRQHFTQPPPRFSEASLVKEMERLGIGRPSTYASILSTIQDRGYVEIEDRRFAPTPLGDTVSRLLVRVFPDLFDVDFTSRMEGELDRVEDGSVAWKTLLGEFYPGFVDQLERGKSSVDEIMREISEAEGEACDKCGATMLVKWNKRGRFLGCSRYPECRNTRSLDGAGEGAEDGILGTDPVSNLPVLLRAGPFGHYVQLGEDGGEGKPPRASIPKDQKPEDVSLPFALRLLALPRLIGADPTSGEAIEAGLGRYGPFVRREKTYRNLRDLDHAFTLTLDEALELLATRQGPAVLRAMGPHPTTGKDLNILDGRYGPYVTDGELNASLPKGADPEDVDMDEAVTLLEKAAARGKSKRTTGRGASSAKGGAKGGAKGATKGASKSTAKGKGTATSGAKKGGAAKKGATTKKGAKGTSSTRGRS
jgi:DNA topoisomerase-1